MGRISQFGEPIQLVVDFAMRGPITRFFTNVGRNGGWKNPRTSAWSRKFD